MCEVTSHFYFFSSNHQTPCSGFLSIAPMSGKDTPLASCPAAKAFILHRYILRTLHRSKASLLPLSGRSDSCSMP